MSEGQKWIKIGAIALAVFIILIIIMLYYFYLVLSVALGEELKTLVNIIVILIVLKLM